MPLAVLVHNPGVGNVLLISHDFLLVHGGWGDTCEPDYGLGPSLNLLAYRRGKSDKVFLSVKATESVYPVTLNIQWPAYDAQTFCGCSIVAMPQGRHYILGKKTILLFFKSCSHCDSIQGVSRSRWSLIFMFIWSRFCTSYVSLVKAKDGDLLWVFHESSIAFSCLKFSMYQNLTFWLMT